MKKLRKTFMRGMGWVEFVQVRVLPNVSDPFPEKIVRERLTRVIRLLRGEIAGYSLGDTGERGERSLLEKLRKTFIWGWDRI